MKSLHRLSVAAVVLLVLAVTASEAGRHPLLGRPRVVRSQCYESSCSTSRRWRFPWVSRGGGGGHRDDTEEDDERILNNYSPEHSEPKQPAEAPDKTSHSHGNDDKESEEETAAVGVKSHHKKSNAVGDPDGEGSSDSEDDDEVLSDWDDEALSLPTDYVEVQDLDPAMDTTTTQVQVEVEYVEEDAEEESDSGKEPVRTGGGVGLLGKRFKNRQSNKRRVTKSITTEKLPLQAAWQPFVYLPPSTAALDYLFSTARHLDGMGRQRLDRRTLYGGLLLEWDHHHHDTQSSAVHRKFLEKDVSQQLQAALSLATQPAWRKSFPRPSGIRLYDDSDDSSRGCTLAMQETIAMALAHSLGAGMVILDDRILSTIRQQLLNSGYAEEDVKPAVLIQSLLSMAREGTLRKLPAVAGGVTASISECMRNDLSSGLDDPFDERATSSCQEMSEWEEKWQTGCREDDGSNKPLSLVIFLRTQASTSILKSKSAVETLLRECNSADGINFLVLGKGIDARTDSLPQEPLQQQDSLEHQPQSSGMHPQNMPNAAPWFGFTPHNQNASGQNDPEGSRRFNIFLARTIDANGTPGIVGAIAPPQAGNLFPHMMAMQARERAQQQEEDSPARAELERWAEMLQQQMQSSNGSGMPLPPPQFFNASLTGLGDKNNENPSIGQNMQPPSTEVIQQTLEHALSELLNRLAQMNEEVETSPDLSPDLQKAFSQILRNENLRRGVAENLARAAPALSDPKCQGVLLSIYVPPPPHHVNRGKLPGTPNQQSQQGSRQQLNNMGGWFHKMLKNQEEAEGDDLVDQNRKKQKRVRTMAAAAAVMAAEKAQEAKNGEQQESKADRNLTRLEAVCRPIIVSTPIDPVRAKSWHEWIQRERGSVVFRQNRRALNEQLEDHYLSLQEHTGTRGAGSALRQMLSVRLIADEMEDVIKFAIETEAAKSQRQDESPDEMHENEMSLQVDVTLSQLLITEVGLLETEEVISSKSSAAAAERRRKEDKPGMQYLHPSSLEAALSAVCRISPSPAGGLSVSSSPVAHRSREEIAALAQDKHERALISQVVSPQDIGVTYDMIGGLSDVKELLRQSITYPLKFPHLYSEGIAREAVKGVLLFGPPGTGKTLLAKAVATEGGASFLSVDASSVENKWLGESEKNAKAVFTLARRLAPCVIFIDEVDSLLSSRDGTSDDSAHGTLTSVKTTMMSEWDGLNSGTNGAGEAGSDRVVVIGSTNRPFDLDEAVLRRFPRRILVDLPDLATRKEILEVTLAENRLDPSVNLTKIAERLEGYTGSDIKEVCREAVVQISHEQAKLLDRGFVDTREDVTQGSLQRLRPVTAEDFEKSLKKLTRSVSEKGRELARVWEWNDEYGEIKKEKKNHLPHLANMYL